MKISRIILCFLLILASFISFNAVAQTTVYIIRHAEEDLKKPGDTDPPLSLIGQDRAKDLATFLRPKRILAVYSTPFKRARQTVGPLAYGHGLTVKDYDPADPASLAASILRQHKGGAVVISGHSNTVLELVEAFGIGRPLPALNEDEYNYIFEVAIDGNSIKLLTTQYGKLKSKKVD